MGCVVWVDPNLETATSTAPSMALSSAPSTLTSKGHVMEKLVTCHGAETGSPWVGAKPRVADKGGKLVQAARPQEQRTHAAQRSAKGTPSLVSRPLSHVSWIPLFHSFTHLSL